MEDALGSQRAVGSVGVRGGGVRGRHSKREQSFAIAASVNDCRALCESAVNAGTSPPVELDVPAHCGSAAVVRSFADADNERGDVSDTILLLS
jgi:hypothetical protein